MTADESTRARDAGDMYAVLPAIESHQDVLDAYRDTPGPEVGAYRSDSVPPIGYREVLELVTQSFAESR